MQTQSALVLLVLMLMGAATTAEEDAGKEEKYFSGVIKDALYFLNACGSKDLSVCLKERILKYVKLLPNEFEIGGVIKVKKRKEVNISTEGQARSASSLPDEPRAREDALDTILLNKAIDFLSSHSIELKVPDDTINQMKSSLVEEGRGKKKKKGGGLHILLLFYMKAAMLAAIALKVLALLAFKALVIGKIALTISGIIALKKLLEQKHHTSTYEVIAHPHYEEHHERSFGQEMAYKGQQDILK